MTTKFATYLVTKEVEQYSVAATFNDVKNRECDLQEVEYDSDDDGGEHVSAEKKKKM